MKKKKSNLGFWVKQLRRPLCFLVVVALVLSYNFISNAEGAGTFRSRYSIPDSVTDYAYRSSNSVSYWTNDGHSSSVLYINGTNYPSDWGAFYYNYNQWYTYPGSGPYSNFMNFAESYTFPTQCTISNVTYDLTSCPIYCVSGQSGSINSIYFIVGNGKKAFVDTWLTSDESFIVILWTTNFPNDFSIISNVDTPSDNGLYLHTPQVNNSQNFTFTDLPIYFRSSDGSSGYTTFSNSDIGDFDVNEIYSDNYYDFNYLRKAGSIISPDDPNSTYDANGEHYNYGTVNHKVFGKPFDSLYYGSTIGINSYMRENANKFWLFTDAKIGVKFAGESNISEFEQNDSVSISSFIRNNSSSYSQILEPGLMMNGGVSLSAKLRSGYSNIAGSDFGYSEGIWSDGSFVFPDNSGFGSYYEYTYKPLKGNLLGNTDHKLEVAYLDLTSWFSYDGTNDDIINVDTNSGYYHVRFNLLDGSYNVIQNDISQNLNPIEGENNLPISGIGSGSSGGGTGNINITQGGISNNLNAIIEYLFQLDASGMQNVSQNVGSTIQYVVSNIGDTRNTQNGFWDVLKKGYSVIPDDIWNWIKISVATLLSGAVITWVYNGVRVKRG